MRIMLSAGEVSGDLHASFLAKELKKKLPSATFFGMGSERMREAGVDVRLDITKRNTIGLIEILPQTLPLLLALRQMKGLLVQEKPDFLILVDSQGFNLPLAEHAKKFGVKTVYYIPPQEWLWGTEKGLHRVAECVDLIVAIWEKEYEAYQKVGAKVVYFGHPLLDIVEPVMKKAEFCEKYGLNEKDPIFAICPGSRAQEITGLLPIFLKASDLIRQQNPKMQFILPVPSSTFNLKIYQLLHGCKVEAIDGKNYAVLAHADVVMAASGTVNLEACILGTPNVMVYKLNLLTYLIGMYIMRIKEKMKYFSMPNILCDEQIIPEIIQFDVNPQKIADTVLGLYYTRDLQKPALARVKEHLGKSPVISKIAAAILNEAKML